MGADAFLVAGRETGHLSGRKAGNDVVEEKPRWGCRGLIYDVRAELRKLTRRLNVCGE